jgi:hypothetical protein
MEDHMRRRDFVIASLGLPFATAGAATMPPPSPVVLELFTSQGCSSCPPADALLGELTRGPGVIGLAWHVDYWNSLGWRDQYARPEWTERQRGYARFLKGEVYTPALIVNGAAMMIGSDKSSILRAISAAPPPPVAASLRRTPTGLEAEIAATSTPVTGLLVTYDAEQSTQVGAGENQGRRLVEYRVVREARILEKLAPKLTLPLVPATSGVALIIQDANWRVVGAADLRPGNGV